MTVRQGQQVALVDGDSITDTMRARFAEIVKEDPYTGIAAAALRAGIPGTRRQQKQLVAQDPELQLVIADARRAYLQAHGIGVERLITKLATVVENDESSSQLRAITLGLTLNGVHTDVQRVEHTGADGGAVEVTVEHDHSRLIDKLSSVGLIQRGPLAAADPSEQRVLPARTD